ncbi:hypothetical protein BU15DRAFT_67616 [Melanogaster broomeanus]|nr:hypothetical protein BU15DRAFT_67616 [Melanogaster broomeanus]
MAIPKLLYGHPKLHWGIPNSHLGYSNCYCGHPKLLLGYPKTCHGSPKATIWASQTSTGVSQTPILGVPIATTCHGCPKAIMWASQTSTGVSQTPTVDIPIATVGIPNFSPGCPKTCCGCPKDTMWASPIHHFEHIQTPTMAVQNAPFTYPECILRLLLWASQFLLLLAEKHQKSSMPMDINGLAKSVYHPQQVHHLDEKSLLGFGHWLLKKWELCQGKKETVKQALEALDVDEGTLQSGSGQAQVAHQTRPLPSRETNIIDHNVQLAKAQASLNKATQMLDCWKIALGVTEPANLVKLHGDVYLQVCMNALALKTHI